MNDHDSTVVPLKLDGTTVCPRQIQEGEPTGARAWYQDLLDEYAPLSIDEVRELIGLQDRLWNRPWVALGDRALSDREHIRFEKMTERRIRHQERLIKAQRDNEKQSRKHASHDLGAREFTLTYSPKWMDDATARVEMEKAIEKLCRYYRDEIIELRAVGEVGSNGLSHVHCFYKLEGGKKMTDKNFKRAWNHWNPKKKIGRGFEGGHHANVREESDFRGYIDKDVASAWLEKNLKKDV